MIKIIYSFSERFIIFFYILNVMNTIDMFIHTYVIHRYYLNIYILPF